MNLIADNDDDSSGTNSAFKLITAPGFYYLRLKPHLSGNGDFLLRMKPTADGFYAIVVYGLNGKDNRFRLTVQ